LLNLILQASLDAGKVIMEVYSSKSLGIELKADDSPVTKADLAANDVIVAYLETTGIPVLSEEGRSIPYNERKNWEQLWIVDPLDGTKEFIKKNGEFTVNIALIEKGIPVTGGYLMRQPSTKSITVHLKRDPSKPSPRQTAPLKRSYIQHSSFHCLKNTAPTALPPVARIYPRKPKTSSSKRKKSTRRSN
jgi:3'-phosphoadenosine 5'-phosphosulfate (PAPS) 3'-phosphatase